MELSFRITIGIILIGVAAKHHCHGYDQVGGNDTSVGTTQTPAPLERFRRLIPYMTYYVAQNLAYPETRAPLHTGYLVPAYLIAGSSSRRPQVQPVSSRPLPPPPAPFDAYDYPYRRYKPQPQRNDQLRLLIQQQKQKQLIQLLEDERRAQQRRLEVEQQAKLYQQLEQERVAKLREERVAKQLQEERIAKQLQEERRAKQLQLFLEEDRRSKLVQSRPPVVEQQLVVSLDDDVERGLQSDVHTAAAQRQQYDALLQSHNEQELANSIVPTPPPLVQITSPTTVSKLAHHIAANLQKSNNELPPAVSAAHFDLSVKSVLRLLAELQRTKALPVASTKGKEVVKTKAGVFTQTFPAPTVEGSTPGRPGIDYPAYDIIPTTSFSCQTQRYKGFFGDPETNCQVWHYCDLNGGQASFLCPNGTIFSQVGLTCDWWFNVRCSSTPQLYVLNERLYKYILPMKPSFPEDYSGPVVDRYLANKFKEMQQEKKAEAEAAEAEAAEADKGDKSSQEGNSTAPPTTQLTIEDTSQEDASQEIASQEIASQEDASQEETSP